MGASDDGEGLLDRPAVTGELSVTDVGVLGDGAALEVGAVADAVLVALSPAGVLLLLVVLGVGEGVVLGSVLFLRSSSLNSTSSFDTPTPVCRVKHTRRCKHVFFNPGRA